MIIISEVKSWNQTATLLQQQTANSVFISEDVDEHQSLVIIEVMTELKDLQRRSQTRRRVDVCTIIDISIMKWLKPAKW